MNKEIMRQCGFDKEVDNVTSGKCATCGQPIDILSFRNEISVKEYGISGMCQKCQDDIFSRD